MWNISQVTFGISLIHFFRILSRLPEGKSNHGLFFLNLGLATQLLSSENPFPPPARAHLHTHAKLDLHTSNFQWSRRRYFLVCKWGTEAQWNWCGRFWVSASLNAPFLKPNLVLWPEQQKCIYTSPDEVCRSCLEFICALNLCWAEQRSSRYLHVFAVSVMKVCFLPLKLLSIMNFFL